MDIETEYAAKLFFTNPTFVQIYFEAVANALDAGATDIKIHISPGVQSNAKDLEITVTDNGQGFTDQRFERFRRLMAPSDKNHKGLGRLVYLHYFSTIKVESVFGNQKRKFTFSYSFKGDRDDSTTESSVSEPQLTILRFTGFCRNKLRSFDDIKPGVLKGEILEQFLPRLYDMKESGQAFNIRIDLDTTKSNKQNELFSDLQSITHHDVPQLECITFKDPAIDVYTDISMRYILRKGDGEKTLLTAVCVDGRTIPIKKLLNLNAIPLNHSAIFLFESELLNGNSDSARQRLILPENISENTFYGMLRRRISKVLNEKLPEIEEANTKTRQKFEEQYPHLSGLFDEDTVGIIDKDEAIKNAQERFFKQQKEVLESDSLDEVMFEKSLEVSSRTLTEYILYREIIIRKLRETTHIDKEEDIHNLIVPQRRQFHGNAIADEMYNNNAWLLDDKFMSFRTILSEADMQQLIAAITSSEDATPDLGRPDISMIFSADPAKVEKVDVVVIELKRRKVDDKENLYAAAQLVKRARKLAEHCPNIQRVWYFAIVEIDAAFSNLLKDMDWIPLFSKGQVFYRETKLDLSDGSRASAPIFILSYDAVIQDAAARNHTFLEILKNDFKRATSAKK